MLPGAHRAGEWLPNMWHTRHQTLLHDRPRSTRFVSDFREATKSIQAEAASAAVAKHRLDHLGPAKEGSIFPVSSSVNPDT